MVASQGNRRMQEERGDNMTLNGAIMQLVELSEHPMMPVVFRPLIQKVIETISELEENPEPQWIPVTEATPTEDDDYWCTFEAETGWFVDWCSWYHGRWVVWTDNTVSEVRNVIAWMPLPESYRGE